MYVLHLCIHSSSSTGLKIHMNSGNNRLRRSFLVCEFSLAILQTSPIEPGMRFTAGTTSPNSSQTVPVPCLLLSMGWAAAKDVLRRRTGQGGGGSSRTKYLTARNCTWTNSHTVNKGDKLVGSCDHVRRGSLKEVLEQSWLWIWHTLQMPIP